jgi:hypothetical protein
VLAKVRRGARTSAIVALALTVTACANWSQLGGSASRDGFQPLESSIGTTNVSSLVQRWTASIGGFHGEEGSASSPAVANGVVFEGYAGALEAYDAAGSRNCSGAPTRCTPLWTAYTDGLVTTSSPAVADGVVYTTTDEFMYAFDAAGVTGCSGSPKVCQPLWTAYTGLVAASPAVAGGKVYTVSVDGHLSAFDTAYTSSFLCGAIRKSCAPRWTADLGSPVHASPAVAGGFVYAVTTSGSLETFDAAGVTDCDQFGTRACTPVWTAGGLGATTAGPVVSGGRVYVGLGSHMLYGFDAAGTTNCAGAPRTCAPLWRASTSGEMTASPAVADGTVYVATATTLAAFDATGTTGCSGHPTTCTARWTAPLVDGEAGAPIVANHVVYTGSGYRIHAFDASGTAGCSGSPATCTPLWSSPDRGDSWFLDTPVVVNGSLIVVASNPGSFVLEGYTR